MGNKKGKSDLAIILGIIVVAALVAYAFDIGDFKGTANGWFGSSASTPTPGTGNNLLTANCPSDGTTTLTLYTPDKLATTATNVVTEYYVFDGNQLVTSGTNTGASASVALTCGKDYQIQLLNSTASAGAYGQIVTLQARQTKQSLTVPMVQMGGAAILSIQNPGDPARNPNVSLVAGATKQFVLTFDANTTVKGYNQPIILCQVNTSSIQSMSIGSFSDGTSVTSATVPTRISTTAGYKYYAFAYSKMLDPTLGVISASGTITASSTTPSTSDSMSCKLADQATWKSANFQSLGLAQGFKTGAENTETNSEVGAADSAVAYYYYNGTY